MSEDFKSGTYNRLITAETRCYQVPVDTRDCYYSGVCQESHQKMFNFTPTIRTYTGQLISKHGTLTANCPSGYKVMHGGCGTTNTIPQPEQFQIKSGYPSSDTAWRCDAHADHGVGPNYYDGQLTASVVCINVDASRYRRVESSQKSCYIPGCSTSASCPVGYTSSNNI